MPRARSVSAGSFLPAEPPALHLISDPLGEVVAVQCLHPATRPVGDLDAIRTSSGSIWLELHDEIKTHTRHLKQITTTVAPQLLDAYGIGTSGPTSQPRCSCGG